MNDKIKLSKTTLAKLQPEPGKQLIFWDSDITGFGVRVSPGGSQTFFCQSRFKGKVVKYTIGQNSRITPEKNKSELYRDLLPMLNSNTVELPPDNQLQRELLGLERRTARGGRDSIDHSPGLHDDLANAVAGAAVYARMKSDVAFNFKLTFPS
jgi:hypothetical protein